MRQIKFRLWDKKQKKFWHDFRIHPQGTFHPATGHKAIKGVDYWVYDYKYNQKHLEPLQYTGCIDKNGKEIYEGDIVRDDTTGSIWAVTWNAEAAGWTDKPDNPYSYGLYKSLEHCMEVIGNIYENPNILEEVVNNG